MKNISYRLQFINSARFMATHQVLSIIPLKESIKLNAKMNTILKNLKLVELNTKIVNAVLNTWELKMI